MPASGAARPFFSSSNSAPLSPPDRASTLMTSPIERDRFEQAPEGAEQAEEDQQAGEIAQDLAAFVEARREGIEHGALVEGGEALDRPVNAPSSGPRR